MNGVAAIEEAPPGQAVGASVGAPAATDVVTGRAEFTMDTEIDGLLHLKVLHSPHAHARIVSIDKTAALAVPGVHRVYTWEDVPRKRFTTAIHTDHLVDPDDTYILDNVVRFVGQRVVAVLADSVGAAEEGCRKVVVEYEVLPAVFDPEEAMADGAPQLHGSDDPFVRDPVHNILLDLHGQIGDVEAGFAEADVIHEGTYFSPRVQHAHLETHGSIAWMEDGRLHVRTSSQSPSIAKVKLAHLFGLRPDQLRVFCKRVGGGFGGKQEVIAEDLVALATLDTGRPVCFEYTREEEFTTASPRHPMKITVRLGARADGTLTAFQFRNVSNTGAYGNHGGETVVYRFDSIAHLQAWINSETRQRFSRMGAASLTDRPGHAAGRQRRRAGGRSAGDGGVITTASHPDDVDEFLDWQRRMGEEESKFEGYRGTELFRPVAGIQDEWTTLYRFRHRRAPRRLADVGAAAGGPRRWGERFNDFKLRTVDNSFGSWFAFKENGREAPPPSETKTAVAVWVGLYPTVVLLTLALSPLEAAPVARAARGQPAVELHHELPDHALLPGLIVTTYWSSASFMTAMQAAQINFSPGPSCALRLSTAAAGAPTDRARDRLRHPGPSETARRHSDHVRAAARYGPVVGRRPEPSSTPKSRS